MSLTIIPERANAPLLLLDTYTIESNAYAEVNLSNWEKLIAKDGGNPTADFEGRL